MNKQKVSIIVPIYNVADFLPMAIDSLIKQTYDNLEILLIDDGATDNSGAIADKYAQIDSRIQVFHKVNGGLSDSRNFGLQKRLVNTFTFLTLMICWIVILLQPQLLI